MSLSDNLVLPKEVLLGRVASEQCIKRSIQELKDLLGTIDGDVSSKEVKDAIDKIFGEALTGEKEHE